MTATKTKNGTTATATVNDAAAQAAQEAKAMMDNWMEAANKAVAEGKPMLDAQQKIVTDSFAMWQEYNKAYLNFFTQTTQQVFEQSLAHQNEWLKMAEGNWKKGQELLAAEQAITLDAVESMQVQMQAVYERSVKIFTPVIS